MTLSHSAESSADASPNAIVDPQVLAGLPHRGSMLLIDRILDRTPETIVCEKTFREGEFFFDGHFPNRPIVPGVIQCECCLQAGALLLAAQPKPSNDRSAPSEGGSVSGGSDDSASRPVLPVATRMDAVKLKKMIGPGDRVEISVTLKERVSNAYYMTGKMTLDGKLTARLDFTCSLVSS